jgi:hypothetical protein
VIRVGSLGRKSELGSGLATFISIVRNEPRFPSHHDIFEEAPRLVNDSTPKKGCKTEKLDCDKRGTD